MSTSGFKHGPIKYKQSDYDLKNIKEQSTKSKEKEKPNDKIFCSTISGDIWNTTLKYTNSIRSRKDLLLLTSMSKSNRPVYEMRKFDFAQSIPLHRQDIH